MYKAHPYHHHHHFHRKIHPCDLLLQLLQRQTQAKHLFFIRGKHEKEIPLVEVECDINHRNTNIHHPLHLHRHHLLHHPQICFNTPTILLHHQCQCNRLGLKKLQHPFLHRDQPVHRLMVCLLHQNLDI